jgi:DNA-binding NarL/FixJ family response regulator
MRILVADDHAVVRAGIKQLVADYPGITVAGEARSGQEVLDNVSKNQYDVVLLDISMPDITGLDILKELKSRKPSLPVLMLTIHPEEQYAVRAFRAGASGYLTKGCTPDELIGALDRVSCGGKYVSSSLAERMAFNLGTDIDRLPHESLSDREYQVMCMLASGKKVKEIATELVLSIKTVATYRSRILSKMKFRNTVELTRYAILNDLLP